MQVSMSENSIIVSLSPRIPPVVSLPELRDYVCQVLREAHSPVLSVADVWKATHAQAQGLEVQLQGVSTMLVYKDQQFRLPVRWLITCNPDEDFVVVVVLGKRLVITSPEDNKWEEGGARLCLSVGKCKVYEE